MAEKKVSITKSSFGTTEKGEKVEAFVISTDLLKVTLLNYGYLKN